MCYRRTSSREVERLIEDFLVTLFFRAEVETTWSQQKLIIPLVMFAHFPCLYDVNCLHIPIMDVIDGVLAAAAEPSAASGL